VHATAFEFDEEQDVVAAQQHGVDAEEVTGDDPGRLSTQECRPRFGVPARCRMPAFFRIVQIVDAAMAMPSRCRLHAALADLAPGGIAKELNASDAFELLGRMQPTSPVEQTRHDLAVELLDDVRRLDAQLKASHKRIRDAVRASDTSLTELFGVGPIIACSLIGCTGDVRRFANRDQFAAYNGTAPIEHSSAGRVVHRLSRRGNRRLNHAIHMAAICQIRQSDSEGRVYFDRRVAEGKTKKEALRSLKRHVSNAVYRQLLADAQRTQP
jgi:transposase